MGAVPERVGSLKDCRDRCIGYSHMQLVSCAYPLDGEFDFDSIPRHMADFDARIDLFAESVRRFLPDALVLSNEGCARCQRCTWPDAPCRFPEKLYPAIEGYGFMVSKLAGKAGIKYNNGSQTVTFFGAVLF